MSRATVAAVWALALACGRPAPPHDVSRSGRGAELQAVERALDGLEERLLVGQARVSFWEEMRERHESVSAIATVNLERHADAMAHLERREQEKRGAPGARRQRVAARMVPTAQAAR